MVAEQEWTLTAVQTAAHWVQWDAFCALVRQSPAFTDSGFHKARRVLTRTLRPADCPLALPPDTLPEDLHRVWREAAWEMVCRIWRIEYVPRGTTT